MYFSSGVGNELDCHLGVWDNIRCNWKRIPSISCGNLLEIGMPYLHQGHMDIHSSMCSLYVHIINYCTTPTPHVQSCHVQTPTIITILVLSPPNDPTHWVTHYAPNISIIVIIWSSIGKILLTLPTKILHNIIIIMFTRRKFHILWDLLTFSDLLCWTTPRIYVCYLICLRCSYIITIKYQTIEVK